LQGMSEAPDARVRRLCMTFPEAFEKEAWGAPTYRAGTKGKMFATFSNDHHGDGHVSVWMPAPTGMQQVLVSGEPKRYFRPAYVGPRGWIGVVLSRSSDDEILAHLREAFLMVATKRLARELE
jgi:hypothetical protein